MRPLVLGLLVSTPALAGPAIILFPSVGTPAEVHVAGRVLKHAPSQGSSKLSENLRLLASSNWEGAQVQVRVAGREVSVVSGHDGDFEAVVPSGEHPFEVGLGVSEALVKGADPARATVDVLDPKAPFFVVSDFDDTIAVTNVLDKGKLIQSALLKDGDTQPAVPDMAAFYGCLRSDKPARPAFALVSGSPVQYTARVERFLTKNAFPAGFGLYLRDLGPNTLSDYKQPVIRALMTHVPNQVVFIGDSGEHDPEVYAQLRKEFPGRVLAVYIRNAGHAEDLARFKDMLLFTTPSEAAADAAKKGLLAETCAKRELGKSEPRDGG